MRGAAPSDASVTSTTVPSSVRSTTSWSEVSVVVTSVVFGSPSSTVRVTRISIS